MIPEEHVTGCGPTALAVEEAAPSSADMVAKFSVLRDGISPHIDARAAAADRYVFGEVFARGGLGQIRRAFDPVLGRTIAIKEMLVATGSERFVREAQVTAQLEHPAIVPVHDLGVHANGQPYYCMKLIDGRSLDEVITATRSLADRIVLLPHLVNVAEAVAFAHSKGLLHRDLKPANILIGNFGETWVIDWGLTGYFEPEEPPGPGWVAPDSERARLTRTGEWMGTLPYMAPEQRSGQGLDERADVYGLGAVLYHTLSGQRPYGDVAEEDLSRRVLDHSPTDLERVVPDVPPELLAIVRKAMARAPEGRYPQVRALIDDLRRFLGGRLVAAHTYRITEVIRRWARPRRAVLSVIGLALAVLGMFGVYGMRNISYARDVAERNERRATEQQHAAEAARDDAERKGAEVREALATRLEDVGRRELIELRRPLDAIEPLKRALEVAPSREYLRTMLAHARQPLHGLRCDRSTEAFDAVVVHPTLPLVAIASDRRRDVQLWDTQNCVLQRSLVIGDHLRSLRFSADGAALLAEVEGQRPELVRFDLREGGEPERSEARQAGNGSNISDTVDTTRLEHCGHMPRGRERQVWRGEAHPSGLVVAQDPSGDLQIWSAATRACVGAVGGNRVTKWRIVQARSAIQLLTLDGDGRLSIWSIPPSDDLKHVSTLNLEQTGIFDFDVGSTSSILVTIGREGSLRTWDLTAMLEQPELLRAGLMALHAGGDSVVVYDGVTVRRIGLPFGGPMGPSWELPALDMLSWDPDGTLAAQRGTQLLDWDPNDPASPAILDVEQIFAPGGLEHDAVAGTPFVAVSGVDAEQRLHVLRMYDQREERWHTLATSDRAHLSAQSFLGAGATRVLLGGTGTLLDAYSGEVVATLDDSAVFTADGAEILSLSREQRGLARHDARTGESLGILDAAPRRPLRHRGTGDTRSRLTPSGAVEYRAVAYSPSGRAFAALGPGPQVTLWDEQMRERIVTLDGHRLPPHRVLWSPDETRVLTFGNDEVAKLWDSETGLMYAELAPVGRGARAVFSRASPHWAIQSGVNRLVVLDTTSGADLFAIPTDSLVDMAFAPDGQHLYIVEAPSDAEMTLRTIELEDAPDAGG